MSEITISFDFLYAVTRKLFVAHVISILGSSLLQLCLLVKKLQGFKWSEILRRETNSQLLLNVEWKYWRESRRRWRLDYRFFRFSSCQEFLSSFSSKKLKNELYNLKWQLSQKNWFFVAWPQKVFFVVGQTFKLREDQYNWCMMPKSGYNFKYRSITDYSNPRRV